MQGSTAPRFFFFKGFSGGAAPGDDVVPRREMVLSATVPVCRSRFETAQSHRDFKSVRSTEI